MSEPNQIGTAADSRFLAARKQKRCVPYRRRTTRNNRHDLACSGLITCGHCGRVLVGKIKYSGHPIRRHPAAG